MSRGTDYNKYQLDRLEKLLSEERNFYKVDLHIHTCHSADALQSVDQVLQKANENDFDIISITDHDSVGAYDEIIDKTMNPTYNMPVVIPGIEFTVSYPLYNERCHILKYFFDITHRRFLDQLAWNKRAFNYRVKLWFERLDENKYLQNFFELYNIICSESDYWEFMDKEQVKVPEYSTLAKYLYSKLSNKGINVWDVYQAALEDNLSDPCEERRIKKTKALETFQKKYLGKEISNNYRKLRPIIAAVGVDDADFPDYPSRGSLSIGEYGQIPIQQLKECGFNVFAHPNAQKLECIDDLIDIIDGLELNCQSSASANALVYKKGNEKQLILTHGSDKHSSTNEFYEDLSFYEMPYDMLKKFVWKAKQVI